MKIRSRIFSWHFHWSVWKSLWNKSKLIKIYGIGKTCLVTNLIRIFSPSWQNVFPYFSYAKHRERERREKHFYFPYFLWLLKLQSKWRFNQFLFSVDGDNRISFRHRKGIQLFISAKTEVERESRQIWFKMVSYFLCFWFYVSIWIQFWEFFSVNRCSIIRT